MSSSLKNWPPEESIEERGWRLWADPRNPHGPRHDCLMCALVRKARGIPPLGINVDLLTVEAAS
jgi:hypothetical protein